MNALKRRAQAVLNDRSIDPQTRAVIRYALEINDPWLAQLVRLADAGESIETLDFSQTPEPSDSGEEKIEALAEMICRAGDESAAALLSSWRRSKTQRIRKHSRIKQSTLHLITVRS